MKKTSFLGPIIAIFVAVFVFFYPFFLKNSLPIPADTIAGLYYPFRDLYSATNPNGLPYKNFLVTDPVRQQYPWKNMAIGMMKRQTLPIWNPYEMAGTPLLANFQSSALYPLNILLIIFPFYNSWSWFIVLQPLLAGLFLYLYLKNIKVSNIASFLGAFTWSFCGFSVAWLEWGIIIHTALWLPLILLAVDKITIDNKYKAVNFYTKFIWSIVYVLALLSSFLAGHLQIFFYLFIFSNIYFLARAFRSKNIFYLLGLCLVLDTLFIILSLPQMLPTLQFILLSNRSLDQSFTQPGWFIPYQNLAQFVAPDFFGNPATLNYFGIWNYAEFIGYVGIISLMMALYAVFLRRDKKTWFFAGIVIACLILATSNFLSQLPFISKIPFISTAQPTRLIFLIDLSLSVLAALGFDYFLKHKNKIWVPEIIIGGILALLWGTVVIGSGMFSAQEAIVAKNNLKLPTLIFAISSVLVFSYVFVKYKKIKNLAVFLILAVVLFDLLRFGWKFTPFSNKQYLYPETKITQFLQKQKGTFRIASTDLRILPPNFSVVYKLESIEGYDPLYLENYAEFIAGSQREDHSILPPFGFNRIITPHNLNTQAIDFLNVKYVLSLSDIKNSKFKKVLQYGETKIYENKNVMPRAFFVKYAITAPDKYTAAGLVFSNDLSKTAIIVDPRQRTYEFSVGKAHILKDTPDEMVVDTSNGDIGMLVVSDTYYPTIHATIDGNEAKINSVNLAFRGLVVPAGKHRIVFEAKIF